MTLFVNDLNIVGILNGHLYCTVLYTIERVYSCSVTCQSSAVPVSGPHLWPVYTSLYSTVYSLYSIYCMLYKDSLGHSVLPSKTFVCLKGMPETETFSKSTRLYV